MMLTAWARPASGLRNTEKSARRSEMKRSLKAARSENSVLEKQIEDALAQTKVALDRVANRTRDVDWAQGQNRFLATEIDDLENHGKKFEENEASTRYQVLEAGDKLRRLESTNKGLRVLIGNGREELAVINDERQEALDDRDSMLEQIRAKRREVEEANNDLWALQQRFDVMCQRALCH
mmetsp:Transcript_3638/g.7556  ORF Transcript_3638/g.7556 Transcript_3638/m.7556 type:complete len:180 (-) Transcript_3638:111-650(-)